MLENYVRSHEKKLFALFISDPEDSLNDIVLGKHNSLEVELLRTPLPQIRGHV